MNDEKQNLLADKILFFYALLAQAVCPLLQTDNPDNCDKSASAGRQKNIIFRNVKSFAIEAENRIIIRLAKVISVDSAVRNREG